ncbi:transport protein (probable substrate cationic amino acids) [Natrialba magadii ATCC 43099]|uniref:Amino acid permease-associated protein n=1 Tax=Natrialba magadii (strain ATCC 43099 / DSM 3394 / CCM 3739 / CIP 104546 / IAM 13178 / JCM 8861 / NBRC 102185 / NCIMB 2190 / MS3) TaxID=547559 RepID=D3SXY9_NATMM|nr:amino acid permease [Natrialba magadii]ADD04029.1 transport protein (probable substrate cationic amino acids) [Natrialba magadii ATCC 43099]ELY33186.1 amino acid permease-associated protein [Natrialba magadii ATCC 43099]
MAKDLERDLGLFSVIAISMGAMIGSGIFILPGIAMAEAGPAVILSFVIAAILVVPAALSIAELGTAMPEAGGDYVFIERGMGPAVGTIAGLGTWLMLMLKGALALVGGMFYLEAVMALPSIEAVAVTFALILIAVNLIGVKQTGGLQLIMVIVMLLILSVFVAGSIIRVDGANYDPFFTEGLSGVFTATATVLVSYAGVTKVAAVAEEIENPGRNLPLGLLASLVATSILYALLVFVLVGVIEGEILAGEEAPMAEAVDVLFGELFLFAIVLAALLALVSTANAGILTASRYPLALSRDNLFLDVFEYIHPRFATPIVAIVTTGAFMIFAILTLDVEQIAKSAGAFQILVYILVCGALIAFRERDLEWYDPDFYTPGYPWVQLFGIVSGVFIIGWMDLLPIAGSIGIVIFGYVWYKWYAESRVEREGVAKGLARREAGRQFVRDTEEQLEDDDRYEVLIPIRRDVTREQEDALIQLAAPIVRREGGRIRVIRFDEVPDQVPLDTAAEELTPEDAEFEERTDDLVRYLGIPVEVGEIVSHDTRHAVVNFAERTGSDLVLARQKPTSRLDTLFGRDTDWIMEHAPCDVVFVQHEQPVELEEIAIVTDRSPFNDPLKVELADAMADILDARVRFVFTVSEDAPEELEEAIEEYHAELDELCTVPVDSSILRTNNAIDDLTEELESAQLVMLSTVTHRRLPDLLIEQRSDRIAASVEGPVLLVHSKKTRRGSFLRPVLDRVLFD